jgi:hypothetical protein
VITHPTPSLATPTTGGSPGILYSTEIFGGRAITGISGFHSQGARSPSASATAAAATPSAETSSLLTGNGIIVAVTRRFSDGQLCIFVDGQQDTCGPGNVGSNRDVSYRDGRSTSFPNSDPFLVIGAEKHDAGPSYPSYRGWIDEVRLSDTLRYTGNFTRPSAPFIPDGFTVALYHFDEGSGNTINDSSGAAGGPSHGVRKYGGSPPGPEWSTDTPFSNDTPALFRVERATGNVYTDGAFFPGGADVAEYVTVSEPVEPGDVVEIDPQNPKSYRKARGPYSPLVAGVISTAPGVVLGGKLGREDPSPAPPRHGEGSSSTLTPIPSPLRGRGEQRGEGAWEGGRGVRSGARREATFGAVGACPCESDDGERSDPAGGSAHERFKARLRHALRKPKTLRRGASWQSPSATLTRR